MTKKHSYNVEVYMTRSNALKHALKETNMTSIVNFTGIDADKMSVVTEMIAQMNGRTILRRSECKTAAFLAGPKLNRTFAWCPAWIVKNDAIRATDSNGAIVHGTFDLSKFVLVEKVIKVKAEKPSKLLTQVIDATEAMSATVESEQLMSEVIGATEAPIVAEVESDKKLNRKAKRAAAAAAKLEAKQ